MKRALIYLEENLPASLALRFADQQAEKMNIILHPIHVEEPDEKLQAGTGWIRRSWEQGVTESGMQEVQRLLKTEKVSNDYTMEPVITVGDRDKEVISQWHAGLYSLYVEGYLNTTNGKDFVHFLESDRLQKIRGPFLIVKNLVPSDRLLLLIGEGVDGEALVEEVVKLYGDLLKDFEVTVLHYQFQERQDLAFKDLSESGDYIERVTTALAVHGIKDPECLVIEGTPEKAAEYMRDHGLVASAFPNRKGVKTELLSFLVNPLLLCKQKQDR